MIKFPFGLVVVSIGLAACTSNPYTKTLDLRFQNKTAANTQTIHVQRDVLLCAGDIAEIQNCPIEFYIDSIKSGTFYVGNSANYHLKPESYNFKVKNCTEESCQSCDVDLNVGKLTSNEFVLSVNTDGKPFISNNGQPLSCEVKHQVAAQEQTIRVDLAADTLFKFNGSSLNDLLIYAELSGDFPLGDSRQPTYKSLRPFDLVS
ncbi:MULTISPECIES: hypothetical protein [unclassified Acinetobacter]|uniref:hypothetical protein n=1 Tax=unclassified Acinetobacter TaxID=196816 RepID=UPI00211EF0A7|nr:MULTISPECIES: hypothetical protein [unclassified Acinetobacter]